MASGITRDLTAGKRIIDAVAEQALVAERNKRLGLSTRQVELNRMYAYFRTEQYESCACDWDGTQHADALTREAIASTAVLPPGYQDPGGGLNTLPLRYRRPSVPSQLCKVIVSRFSDLLFSEGQHPTWKVAGDEETEAWCQEVTDCYDLMAVAGLVRDMGGSMGTALIGFKFVDGRVVFEEFDPRWCFPTFSDKDPSQLVKLEIRYMFPMEQRDPISGEWKDEPFWYRRTITESIDCLWKPQPVGDGSTEPPWDNPQTVANMVEHNMGFVPVEWIQNLRVSGDVDGDPDVLGCYDHFDRISELESAAHKSALRNSDPTPVVSTDGALSQVSLGTDQALQLEKGGAANYLESQGAGAKTAMEVAQSFRREALQISACVLPEEEHDAGSSATMYEISKRTSAMHSKGGKLRTQYGTALVRLMKKLIAAASTLNKGRAQDGKIVRSVLKLPARRVDGQWIEQEIGEGGGEHLKLVWPPFSQPTPQDTSQKVTATVQARSGRIITLPTAVRHVSPDFSIEDVTAEVKELQKEGPPGGDLAALSLQELHEGR